MGIGSIVCNLGWGLATVAAVTGVHAVSPWRIGSSATSWIVLFVAYDFCYYWEHRANHRVRILWASHVVHHSSRHYNLSTALRQTWTGVGNTVFLLPMALAGFPPYMIFATGSANLLYQFWIHTERIDKLPRPFEFVFNTPSHHRVHHGMDKLYLDKNYGGILIVWDRLFGSFQPELFRPHYGLTKQVDTYNIWKLQTREYVAIARDWRSATRLRDRLGYVFGPPGWAPRTAGRSTDAVPLVTPG
jgi:sterol desaturase/sphingolipid hydroxylase (fatty acid hydroxylase superfamily)